ncbi:glycosyltransferase family 4 protein [Altererythrobacter sp. BO-6]|uniref:glycosyltransferase n=1 Tax=Altererythrobacter sp. BO-6 TaxID=2604537 RepID=UPI0013E10CCB|nr:glycosyltransferase [Altererythrobacter sp. BO-6]QIG55308.1 glycosyltransferase family 4 protein [Altererythrobacter sp. BO-6]
MRGGERVVERLLHLFPNADLFTNVYAPDSMSPSLRKAPIKAGFVNRLPFARRLYQYYLPLMPIALEGLDLSEYDLVISSEAGPAKGVITRPDAFHLCYCHSPMRYLWDQYHQYRTEASLPAKLAMPLMYHRLRQWDVTSSARVDQFVANSHFIQQRIRKVWRRESEVIHPPVETSLFGPTNDLSDNYLWVGQMVPYKRPDLAVEAFNALGLPLTMVGTGGMLKNLRAMARPNITFIERLDFASLKSAYARSKALIMTAEEDFGITPVEAMASGRPVIAFGRGGAKDSVVPGETGVFFDRQNSDALIDAVERTEVFLDQFDPQTAIAHARRFAPEEFDRKIMKLLDAG